LNYAAGATHPLVDESDNEFDPANENDAAGKNKKQKQNTLL
jgi:hypothetical protein